MKRILILLALIFSVTVYSQNLQTINGVHSLSYEVEEGSVYIYLPVHVVKGAPFSGTIALYPKGGTTREQSKNLQKLQGYKITLQNKEFSLGTKTISLNGSSDLANVSLQNAKGKPMGSKQVGFSMKSPLSPKTPISLPKHIANDVNSSFYGHFDGNIGNTAVKGNGQPINVIAESPVQICIRPTNLKTISSRIVVTDGDATYQGQCNSIYYTLKVGRMDLKRGQSTFFNATIHGVGTIDEPLSYTVVNKTPGVVSLEGGNMQNFVINPGDGENGNWFRNFTIRSLRVGGFSLTTTLVVPDTPYPDTATTEGSVISNVTSSPAQETIDCRIYNESFSLTQAECEALGGDVHDGNYSPTLDEADADLELSEVSVSTTQDSNEVDLQIDIVSGDLPEMVVATCKPLDPEVEAAVTFLTGQQNSYSISFSNNSFGRPSAASIETTLLYSNGSSQTVNTEVNFDGNPFFSIAESPELSRIRGEQNKTKNELRVARGNKDRMESERNRTRDRYIKARGDYRVNNSQYWYLWRIDQSLEKARPVFADSLKVLIDSLNAFKKRTGGVRSAANTKKIEDNLRDAKKAHQDCLDQLKRLQQEQTDLTNEMATLKEQQKQIHRDIMNLFRSTNMNFAGATRRDKDGNFHYQYGVVTVSGDGTATYHKGSLPAQIAPQVSALEKQMKLVTDRLNAVNERLKNLPGEIAAKSAACAVLGQKVKDAQAAKNNNDAITAENQLWNNRIDALCVKIIALLNRLKTWAAVNDTALLNQINNVKCGGNIWVQINGVINRKKTLERGFQGKAANAKRDKDNAKNRLDELDRKIREEAEKIRNAHNALVAGQKAEAAAAAKALAADQQKCIDIMNELGYGATTIADVIDLYEISQDLKKAADDAKDAMDNLKKAIEYGEKYGMDPGDAKKWVKDAQDRLGKISKRLAKLEKYKNLADKIQEYADRIGTLVGSDGTPTQNAAAFGEGLKFMNEALDLIAEKFPILQVFTAYFTWITEAYGAIIDGANNALKKQYQQLFKDVRYKMNCDVLMRVCRSNNDDMAKIKEWAFNEYVVKPGFDALRRDQTQAKKIIDKLVEQRMAECCFQRLQAIKAAQGN